MLTIAALSGLFARGLTALSRPARAPPASSSSSLGDGRGAPASSPECAPRACRSPPPAPRSPQDRRTPRASSAPPAACPPQHRAEQRARERVLEIRADARHARELRRERLDLHDGVFAWKTRLHEREDVLHRRHVVEQREEEPLVRIAHAASQRLHRAQPPLLAEHLQESPRRALAVARRRSVDHVADPRRRPERAVRHIEHAEARPEIRARHELHGPHERVRASEPAKEPQPLELALAKLIDVERVPREPRPPVVVLRPRRRIARRAHDDRRGRRRQVNERVREVVRDLDDVPLPQHLAAQVPHVPEHQPRAVPILHVERVPRLEPFPRERLERPREAVRVNGRHRAQPEQHLDVKVAPTKHGDRRLAERLREIVLRGQRGRSEEPREHVVRPGSLRHARLAERLRRDPRERPLVPVDPLVRPLDALPQLFVDEHARSSSLEGGYSKHDPSKACRRS